MEPHLGHYNAIIERMIAACRERNITLLANRIDPTHTQPDPAAAVYLDGILRYLNPNIVWREDFEWRTVDYRAHKRRVGWRFQLMRRVFVSDLGNATPSHQAVFDVL